MINNTPENTENLTNVPRYKRFDHLKFDSLNRTREFPIKEWVGEIDNDKTIVMVYRGATLHLGTGDCEIKARENMELLAESPAPIPNITVYHIIKNLKLSWVLPSGYHEE